MKNAFRLTWLPTSRASRNGISCSCLAASSDRMFEGIEFTTEVFESMVSNWWPQGAQSWRSTISTGARLTSPTCPSRARLHRGGSPTCISNGALEG